MLKTKSTQRLFLVLLAASIVSGLGAFLPIPLFQPVLKVMTGLSIASLIGWGLARVYRIFLWRVGRRLAFSYLLIGVLPIPMVNILLVLALYISSCFFLRHLYQQAVFSLNEELQIHTESMLKRQTQSPDRPPLTRQEPHVFGFYLNGRKVAGDARFPAAWPNWLEQEDKSGAGSPDRVLNQFVLTNSTITLASGARDGRYGVIGILDGDLEVALGDRSKIRVELQRSQQKPKPQPMSALGKILFTLVSPTASELSKAEVWNSIGAMLLTVWDSRNITWTEDANQLFDLASGETIDARLVAVLKSTPFSLAKQFRGDSSDIDVAAGRIFLGTGLLLLVLYSIAVGYAFSMIFGLSKAVNQLSSATLEIQNGAFDRRIPVRRRDQLGALHRSFNEMSAHLGQAVTTAAQKEILENELRLARKIQKRLLPDNLPQGEAIEFATVFEPSSAIGGDYFDIFNLKPDLFIVVIADVSGHGLPAGLRMAMLKAALMILIEEGKAPDEILNRLDTMVRSEQSTRIFISMTIGIVDIQKATLHLTNAGHPPTYLLRNHTVSEILLPSSPLGAIGADYATTTIPLQPDDVLVWLSDGFIEAANKAEEPFGYDRIVEVLAQPDPDASSVRNHLVEAVRVHAQGVEIDDDRTMVVMHYRLGAKTRAPTGVEANPLGS